MNISRKTNISKTSAPSTSSLPTLSPPVELASGILGTHVNQAKHSFKGFLHYFLTQSSAQHKKTHTLNSSFMVTKERKHSLGFPIHPSAPPVSKGNSGMLSVPLSSFIPYVLLKLSSETVVPKQEGPSPSTGHTYRHTLAFQSAA